MRLSPSGASAGKLILFAFMALCVMSAATAQTWPNRPIRLILGFPAGGGSDTAARALAEPLHASLGQPVVIDNRPGAGGSIASQAVASAAPDGYTLLVYTDFGAIHAAYGIKQQFDYVKDFSFVGGMARLSLVLIARPQAGLDSVKDLIARARAQPGKLTFGSLGPSSAHFLFFEGFKRAAGIEVLDVPYKGTVQALGELMGGQVDMVLLGESVGIRHADSGKVVALATTANKRSRFAPNTPTFTEAGFPNQVMYSWFSLAGPAGMDRNVVRRLNADLVKALGQPAVAQRFAVIGMDPWATTPEEAETVLHKDIENWRQIIRVTGAKPDGR